MNIRDAGSQDTYYDDISSGYEKLHSEEQEKKVGAIQGILEMDHNDTLLDVGCGSGISTRCWDCRRTGIDPSARLIELARAKDPGGTYLVGGAEALPFDDSVFDTVISVSSIHNFNDMVAGLREMRRVGRSTFVFSVFQRSQHFQKIMRLIMLNFNVVRIIKQEKDIIFLAKQQTL